MTQNPISVSSLVPGTYLLYVSFGRAPCSCIPRFREVMGKDEYTVYLKCLKCRVDILVDIPPSNKIVSYDLLPSRPLTIRI
jgi:hypothetical protein